MTAEAPAQVSCDHCGKAIGVYEPLVMLADKPTNPTDLDLRCAAEVAGEEAEERIRDVHARERRLHARTGR